MTDDHRPALSEDDARALAHCNGYAAGLCGRPCEPPAFDSLVLAAAWVRGWRIGRARNPPPPGEGHAPPPVAESDAAPVAVPSSRLEAR